MDKKLAILSNLMKFEATALFAGVRAEVESDRWFFFQEARRQNFAYNIGQSISPYRASINFTYVFHNISCVVYLEREAHVGNVGEDMWTLSFASIEGKTQALKIANSLQSLKDKGYYIPNGNENLERQMNFSLGLYGACLMHVDVKFPIDRPPLQCFCEVMDCIDTMNSDVDFKSAMQEIANNNSDDDGDDYVMMGDWQTWK